MDVAAAGFLLAVARVAPTVILLPALGLGVASVGSRCSFGLLLALAVAPASSPPAGGLVMAVLDSALSGLPVALVASAALWAASMAGRLMDVAHRPGPSRGASFETLLGLLAAIAFLQGGGVASVAERLMAPPANDAFVRTVATLSSGIGVAVLVAAPVVLSAWLLDLIQALVVRAEPRAGVASAIVGLRPLLVVGFVALLMERVAELAVTAL